MFREAAFSERFADVRLSDYINKIDDLEEKQFAAVTFTVGDGSRYIAFRGTDDTIVGWRENFNMSFMTPVPAQEEAVKYLDRVARGCMGSLRVGGHSKGGNLAVYASMFAAPEIQERISEVYNNDGPGFGQPVLKLKGYQSIRSRIKTIVPQSSIVGMLLEHEEEYEVVKSGGRGPLQHDGCRWEVEGTHFIRLDKLTGGSAHFDKKLKEYLEAMDIEKRREFTEVFFGILESTGAKTLTELSKSKLKNTGTIISALYHLDKDTRDMIKRTVSLLLKEGTRMSVFYK
jgi:hypothetical protein